MGREVTNEDRLSCISPLKLLASIEDDDPGHENDEIWSHRMTYNGVPGMYPRTWMRSFAARFMGNPQHVLKVLRELVEEDAVQGPYVTSRQKKSLEIMYPRLDKLEEVEGRLVEEIERELNA